MSTTTTEPSLGALARLARQCVRHRWIVIGAWVATLILVNIVAGVVGPNYRTDFVLPDSESKEVQDLLTINSPDRAGFTSQVVVKADQGVDDPAVQAVFEQVLAEIVSHGDITATSPYDSPSQISQNGGQIAFTQLDIADTGDFE